MLKMDSARIVATVIFVGSIIMLGDAWLKKDQGLKVNMINAEQGVSTVPQAAISNSGDDEESLPSLSKITSVVGDYVQVNTDLFAAKIALLGGGIKELTLTKHHGKDSKTDALTLFEIAGGRTYIAESGLIGEGLPNHNSLFTAGDSEYTLTGNSNQLIVTLFSRTESVDVTKKYIFNRGSYAIDLEYQIENNNNTPITPNAYFQLLRDGGGADGDTKLQPTYTGGAVYSDETKFIKVDFKDMDKGKLKFPQKTEDGWVGFVQHYFVAAWLPEEGKNRENFMKSLGNNLYAMGYVEESTDIAGGGTGTFSSRLYAGPQEQSVLKKLAPGLDLVVDYGWLTIIASPLFWLLSALQGFVGNWGWSIVLLTIIIKLVFFPLSAAGYKSMAKMRVMAPRLKTLKETYGDDKQKFQQAMMDLYRKEKINPLGGCLPILVQIPFFIALYWVLLASVELRDAPFIFWITDLSAKDPFYVLPVLMALSMVAQSWLSPAPPDPIQAKVMKIMPVVFSIFFFFFASGLVLYWLVNNVLSIAQQWTITRAIEGKKSSNVKQ
jgi:YidC/Oxa1 family membrane protein insertase